VVEWLQCVESIKRITVTRSLRRNVSESTTTKRLTESRATAA
jgi:hypothetical protein